MTEFYDHVIEESRVISKIVSRQVTMRPMTSDEHKLHEATTECANCGGPFSDRNLKVHHHDHVSGEYLFPACQKCNLQLKPRKAAKKRKYCSDGKENYEENFFLPILFHNQKNYDAHVVLKHFEKKYVEYHGEDGSVSFDDVEVTPQNSEKYLQFQIGKLHFLDSFQFFSTSLEELVSLLLKTGKDNFVHTTAHLGTDDDIIFAKGVYPYSYVDSREKFGKSQLPSIRKFHDKLENEPLSAEDYLRAQDTWCCFGCETLKDYHDHCLFTDVLLLADVFENCRKTVLKTHCLDLLHFITLPSLAWAMVIKHTDAELDLITDPDAYLMLEANLRGDMSTISKEICVRQQ